MRNPRFFSRKIVLVSLGLLAAVFVSLAPSRSPALADHTPKPHGMGQVVAGAKAASGTCETFFGNPCEAIGEYFEAFGDLIFGPQMKAVLLTTLMDTLDYVSDKVAFDFATTIVSGGAGQRGLIHDESYKSYGEELMAGVAGEAMGSLSANIENLTDIDLGLCTPPDPLLKLGLQLGVQSQYSKRKPKCDWRTIKKNYDQFASSVGENFSGDNFLRQVAQGMGPGQNSLSFAIGFNIKVQDKALNLKSANFLERLGDGPFKPVKDMLTGKIKSPSQALHTQMNTLMEKQNYTPDKAFEAAMANIDIFPMMVKKFYSVFFNTLVSGLIQKVYTGLFAPDTSKDSFDPFNIEFASISDSSTAASTYSSLISAQPVALENFNISTTFATCPIGQGLTRGIDNCVMDAAFLSAVNRKLTLREALDPASGPLLHGDWPLIPPSDAGRNQDPFCYQYGFCYGNLVKMRKARLIPVGWEIAAAANSVTNPDSLQDIMDEFDNCPGKYCHLIDPNWVLKAPPTQCDAQTFGEQLASSEAGARMAACADMTSCVAEDANGNCIAGYGYCTQEKNIWRFRGDACPSQYASCVSFNNAASGQQANLLLDTVDFGPCNSSNGGCFWNRENKFLDTHGNADPADDTYEWLPSGALFTNDHGTPAVGDDTTDWGPQGSAYITQTWDNSIERATVSPVKYVNASLFAHEDRAYFTSAVEKCDAGSGGCSTLYRVGDPGVNQIHLNVLRNPSFEEDTNTDTVPDLWWGPPALVVAAPAGDELFGPKVLDLPNTLTRLTQFDIPVSANSPYTFTMYAKQKPSGTPSVFGRVYVADSKGTGIELVGSAIRGDCNIVDDSQDYVDMVPLPTSTFSTSAYFRFTCSFTVPDKGTKVTVGLGGANVFVDGVQLELGYNSSAFAADGYAGNPEQVFLKVAPAYLGCDGVNDPKECGNYAQQCTALDVGCNLYNPADRDPAVPAIISDQDRCPAECVGYAAYIQEPTKYDVPADAFDYFIADKTTACTLQNVGCDSFTNMDTVARGGEGVEYFKDLRACQTRTLAGDANSQTYFTWEGSDATGYQLRTWDLLKSNATFALAYAEIVPDLDNDGNPDRVIAGDAFAADAPCTQFIATDETHIVCADDNATHQADLQNDDRCNEHADLPRNPDCREFYDVGGNIHYRHYSQTVSITSLCAPYRKTGLSIASCQAASGYYTTAQECRFMASAPASASCPAAAAGCRAYTGGAGRTATTILDEDFEEGSYASFMFGPAALPKLLSNESLAADGHSLAFTSQTADEGIATLFGEIAAACTLDAGCPGAPRAATYGTSAVCTVAKGETTCGTLADQIAPGKTYTIQFLAKANAPDDGAATPRPVRLSVEWKQDGGNGYFTDRSAARFGIVDLSTDWQVFNLGPVDTSKLLDASNANEFDASSVLSFVVGSTTLTAPVTFYVDHIVLKEAEDNITLIKDSWTIPGTCDATLTGTPDLQHYLGCEAYTDQKNVKENLFQFTRVCSEKVVGCEAYYDTQETASPYGFTYNATCLADFGTSGKTAVTSPVDCNYFGTSLCQIAPGNDRCLFDMDATYNASNMGTIRPVTGYPLLADAVSNSIIKLGILLGPDAVAVSGDVPTYLVNDGSATCSASFAGCQEYGRPAFSQDKSTVKEFASVYYLNRPDEYRDAGVLCKTPELFCEAWKTKDSTTMYFKNPLDQTCEWKASVRLGATDYFGWFKKGTTEPCYTDANGNPTYVRGGNELGVWRNGDVGYADWVGQCAGQYDSCTNFTDTTDTQAGSYPSGKPYTYLDNDTLSEDGVTPGEQCQGSVSQKLGCALFLNTADTSRGYNASASYIASNRADALFGEEPFSKQDPISCPGGGMIDPPGSAPTVDLCAQRCAYQVDTTAPRGVVDPIQSLEDNRIWYTGSCYDQTDCQPLTVGNQQVVGTCKDVKTANLDGVADFRDAGLVLANDVNRIVKVSRDRECSAWLDCKAGQASFNEQQGRNVQVCEQVSTCIKYSEAGDGTSFCTDWDEARPVILTNGVYQNRDISWSGFEYSGYSIPGSYPVEQINQVNVTPTKVCVDVTGEPIFDQTIGSIGLFTACEVPTDCCKDASNCKPIEKTYTCERAKPDYRLLHVAGECRGGDGTDCTTGVCERGLNVCDENTDCAGIPGDRCIFGRCQIKSTSGTDCTTDAQCASEVGFPICDPSLHRCVVALATSESPGCPSLTDTSSCGTVPTGGQASCIPVEEFAQGSCLNKQCITSPRGGKPFLPDTEALSCRGYPEAQSPFPVNLVETWSTPGIQTANGAPDNASATDLEENYAKPSAFKNGVSGISTCAPVSGDVNGDGVIAKASPGTGGGEFVAKGNYEDGLDAESSCVCSYQKITYSGAMPNYYPLEYPDEENIIYGVCIGGDKDGVACKSDDNCKKLQGTTAVDASGGICAKVRGIERRVGWEGYCLERDSSITLYGEQDQTNFGACVTWYPVDRAKGSTDIYGKNIHAGFAEEAYFCADVAPKFTIETSNNRKDGSLDPLGHECSYVKVGNISEVCDGIDLGDSKVDWWTDDDTKFCRLGSSCPPGYFGIIGTCDKDSGANGGPLIDPGVPDSPSMCNEENGTKSYDDPSGGSGGGCPYFCVPKYSFHSEPGGRTNVNFLYSNYQRTGTDTIPDIAEGDPCLPPGMDGSPVVAGFGYSAPSGIINGSTFYLVNGRGFFTAKTYYNDCAVKNLSTKEYLEYMSDMGTDASENKNWLENRYTDNIRVISDLSCETILQVSDTKGAGAAWTNALWDESPYTLEDGASPPFAYQFDTPLKPYGSTIDPKELAVGVSTSIVSCQADSGAPHEGIVQTLPSDGGQSCPVGEIEGADAGARAFGLKSLFSYKVGAAASSDVSFLGVGDISCVTNADCTAPSTCVSKTYVIEDITYTSKFCSATEDAQCNPVGTTCELSSACDSGRCGYCKNGYLEGEKCEVTEDCYAVLFVRADGNNVCISRTRYASIASVYDKQFTARLRMENIFAQSTNAMKYYRWQSPEVVRSVTPTYDLAIDPESIRRADPAGVWDDYNTAVSNNQSLDEFKGGYTRVVDMNDKARWNWDIRHKTSTDAPSSPSDEFPNPVNPIPPRIISLGSCEERDVCREKSVNKFSINRKDDASVLQVGGLFKARAEFFVAADKNQLPIKNIIMDWGDGDKSSRAVWPAGSQIGATDDGNFFPNYRGRDADGNKICESKTDDKSLSLEACETNTYRAQENSYLCSPDDLDALNTASRFCEITAEGNLKNSPCVDKFNLVGGTGRARGLSTAGACVYQPRVYIKDNWGWCAGDCPAVIAGEAAYADGANGGCFQ
ncbi:hypothetical protein HYV73_00440, partial [Candidatus Uhrbacteria bacterium]|nr:hypothetical protein [Candidatus Uhrbacteria bacterium]